MTTLDYLVKTIAALKAQMDSAASYRWATVVQSDPLRIQFDGDSTPALATPTNLAGPLTSGQRVWVLTVLRRAYVLGAAGGMGIPTGALAAFVGAAAPAGWLLCDGASYEKSEYPALAAVLGFTGAGDTFTVPDMRGRVPVGVHPSQAGLTTLGAVGGEYVHTLTVAEMPSHQHDHDQARGGNLSYSEGNGVNAYTAAFGSGRVNTGIVTGQTGGGGAHNNMQPYRTVNWIIKI